MKNLYKALAAFQEKAPVITKDAKAHTYKYADLPSVKEAVDPILKNVGLSVIQPLTTIEGKNAVTTILIHSDSGESIESTVTIDQVKLAGQNEYQSLGSGITYLRRYSLEAILGIVTTKDDDAGGASSRPESSKRKLTPNSTVWSKCVEKLKSGGSLKSDIEPYFSLTPDDLRRLKSEAGIR